MNKPILTMYNSHGYTEVYIPIHVKVEWLVLFYRNKQMENYTRLVTIVVRHQKGKLSIIHEN